jgi:hypothetical protein
MQENLGMVLVDRCEKKAPFLNLCIYEMIYLDRLGTIHLEEELEGKRVEVKGVFGRLKLLSKLAKPLCMPGN